MSLRARLAVDWSWRAHLDETRYLVGGDGATDADFRAAESRFDPDAASVLDLPRESTRQCCAIRM